MGPTTRPQTETWLCTQLSTPFRAQVISLSALPPSEDDRDLNLLCPVRALRVYVERSAPFRQSEQLFVCFGGRTKGSPVTKQRLSRWIVDAISLAYASMGLQCLIGVRAHSTRAWPLHGPGSVVYQLMTVVWRPAGSRRPHLYDFITWKCRPCRHESFPYRRSWPLLGPSCYIFLGGPRLIRSLLDSDFSSSIILGLLSSRRQSERSHQLIAQCFKMGSHSV